MYAALDLPQSHQDAFYKHLGHSETINKNVYQAPFNNFDNHSTTFDNFDAANISSIVTDQNRSFIKYLCEDQSHVKQRFFFVLDMTCGTWLNAKKPIMQLAFCY